ncbi:MAG: DNA recombination protein RmuC [Endomicrobium sp.]|nr:DNA recombination protein RmuC [Endomicrobium sp.]
MGILVLILTFLLGVAVGACLFVRKYLSVSKDNATKEQKISNLTDTIANQTQLSNNIKIEFENIASKVLEGKNSKITDLNKISFESVVAPFKTKIDEFKNKVENLQIYEAEKMSGLQKELEKLVSLNKQVSEEANNLAGALKGENKLQGIWGELTLERIFEYAGMLKGVNYISQKQFKNTLDGTKIPDYVVNLPDDKHIVLDAKTSLSSYEKYYNSQNEDDKKIYLKEHVASVKKHIDELVDKDYANIENLNHPEYVLMFVPIDGAVSLALMEKPELIGYAFKKNIVIVTPSTLLATLKTIECIWHQEYQKKNVLEIAKQGGNLYDKFVTFVQTLIEADKKLSEAKDKTQEAIKRLSSSDKTGDSLIERAQKLKELGVSTKKEIPEELLKTIDSGVKRDE